MIRIDGVRQEAGCALESDCHYQPPSASRPGGGEQIGPDRRPNADDDGERRRDEDADTQGRPASSCSRRLGAWWVSKYMFTTTRR